jgi:iron complex outermembrane recepter protein
MGMLMSQTLRVLSSVQALLLISALSSEVASATTNDSDRASDILEEVTVTAERRAEPLQKTPIAVTAIGTEALEQRSVVNLDEVGRYLPNVNIAYGRGSANEAFIFIRGIGQANDTGGADPGVGEYVDDVYLGRIQGGLFNLNDVASIEVLRGPQGTLYGKNTIGGAVTINSNMPGPKPEYQADVAYGNYNYTKLGAIVSEPLTNALFLRVSANTTQNNGFMANADGPRTNKTNISTGRIVLRALPSDSSELILSLDGSLDRSGPQNGRLVALANPVTTPLFGLITARIGNLAPYVVARAQNPYQGGAFNAQANTALNANDPELATWGVSARGTWNFGGTTVKSITAYRVLDQVLNLDVDESPFVIAEQGGKIHIWQVSQEFRANGNAFDGALDWLAGLFLYRENVGNGGGRTNVDAVPAFIPFGINAGFSTTDHAVNDSEAVYVHASYQLTDRLKATAGARETFEQKSDLATTYKFDSAIVQSGGVQQKSNFSKFTPNFVLDYQITPNQFVYASASEGYKSGGFNGFLAGTSRTYEPETAWTYEVGLKSQFFERRMTSNWAVFYTDYKSIQEQLFTAVTPPPPATQVPQIVQLITNASAAHISGLENETNIRVTPNLTVFENFGYVHAVYSHFFDERLGNLSKNQFQDTPKFNATLGGRYEQSLGNQASGALQADLSYRSKTYYDIVNTPAIAQGAYTLVNSRASLFLHDHKLEIALYGKNLTDKFYMQNGASVLTSFGFAVGYYGEPRTYGIELQSHF